METPPHHVPAPQELLIIGGNLALDLANTIDDPDGPAHHDHVGTWTDLLAWATQVGIATPAAARQLNQAVSGETADDAVTRAQDLRDAITRLFGGCAAGAPPRPEDWRALRPFIADALAHSVLPDPGPGDAVQLFWPPADDPADLWRPIAAAALDLLRSSDLHRLKRCAQCPWMFVDHSRNHSRRWCSMDDCGTAVKMDRYIARRAARKRRV